MTDNLSKRADRQHVVRIFVISRNVGSWIWDSSWYQMHLCCKWTQNLKRAFWKTYLQIKKNLSLCVTYLHTKPTYYTDLNNTKSIIGFVVTRYFFINIRLNQTILIFSRTYSSQDITTPTTWNQSYS